MPDFGPLQLGPLQLDLFNGASAVGLLQAGLFSGLLLLIQLLSITPLLLSSLDTAAYSSSPLLLYRLLPYLFYPNAALLSSAGGYTIYTSILSLGRYNPSPLNPCFSLRMGRLA